jgi:glutaminyl-tRNA synthetase
VQIDGEVTPMSAAEELLFENYTKELKINAEVANTLARDAKLSAFYNEALQTLKSPVNLANIIANEVAREIKENPESPLKFTAKQIAQLIAMVDDATISNKIAKQVFEEMAKNGGDPKQIVEAKGLVQVSDPEIIGAIIDEVIAKNPDNVAKFKDGNKKLLGFFVGQTLKATGGKANPKVVNELVAQKLQC